MTRRWIVWTNKRWVGKDNAVEWHQYVEEDQHGGRTFLGDTQQTPNGWPAYVGGALAKHLLGTYPTLDAAKQAVLEAVDTNPQPENAK